MHCAIRSSSPSRSFPTTAILVSDYLLTFLGTDEE